MDRVTAKVELAEFTKALREYTFESTLDAAEAVNKKGGDVAFKAASSLPTVAQGQAKIKAIGRDNRLWHAIASGGTKLGTHRKGKAVRGQGNKEVARAIYESRLRHVPYSRAVYLVLAAKMGKKVTKVRKSSKIDNALAERAKLSGVLQIPQAVLDIVGIESDHAPIMEKAMRFGLANQAEDMRRYLERKIAKRAKAHSGKGR